MTPEGKVKEKLKKILKPYVDNNLMYFFMPSQGAYAKKGVPDFVICMLGNFIGVETKAPDKKDNVTKLQQQTIDNINNSKGYAIVIATDEDIVNFDLYLKNILIKHENSIDF